MRDDGELGEASEAERPPRGVQSWGTAGTDCMSACRRRWVSEAASPGDGAVSCSHYALPYVMQQQARCSLPVELSFDIVPIRGRGRGKGAKSE